MEFIDGGDSAMFRAAVSICGLGSEGESRCDTFLADGSFIGEVFGLGTVVLEDNQTAFLAAVSGPQGSITLTNDGTEYASQSIRFMDGPVLVQIAPNTGGLAERWPVVSATPQGPNSRQPPAAPAMAEGRGATGLQLRHRFGLGARR